jgi:hypothetical protein
MAGDARKILTLLAEGCEKIATDLETAAPRLAATISSTVPEYDRGYFAGYTEGRIKTYRDMAADFRNVLRDNPPSRFNWPRISLGFTWRF